MTYNFLKEISRVTEMYNRHRKLSGEEFNIFSVMSMEADEVFTHSALLAELLNPKGSHGLGSMPLQLFLKDLLDPDYQMNPENATCKKEEHIGFTNTEKSKGGRVDILVKDLEGNVIIIENKIYAAEQMNQLMRYKTKFPKAELFYLTLDGKESEQNAVNNETEKIYRNLSYEEHIIPWISNCAKLAYNKPMLREVLNQYLFLLKKLTNQTTNSEMAEQITEIIKQNFRASLEIYKNFDKVSTQIKDHLLKDISASLIDKFPLLTFSVDNYKGVQAIIISGLDQNITMKFRFKNQKWPVINITTESSFDGSKLPSFKTADADGKTVVWWKILPILKEERLLPHEIKETHNTFVSEISNVIMLLSSIKEGSCA